HVYAFGVYEAFYKVNYLSNESSSNIAWIGSVQLALLAGLGLFVGPLSDRGYFYHLVLVSSALYIFSNFMLSITEPQHYYQVFLPQGLGMGLAMGIMYTPCLAVVSDHFPGRSRALAFGIACTGTAFGGIIHPILLNNLINRNGQTFRRAVEISAGFSAGLLLLANVFQREKRPLEEHTKTHLHIVLILREPKYLILCVGYVDSFIARSQSSQSGSSIFVYYGSVFPVIYLQLFSVTKGFPMRFSFYLLPMFHTASVVGRILLNFSADRFGSLKVLIITTIGTGAVTFGFLGIGSPAGMTVVTLLIGFFAGGCDLFLGDSIFLLSRKFVELQPDLALPSLSGPPIDGALLTERLIWDRPIIFSSVRLPAINTKRAVSD
ncbi:MFS general substrate transporter, partial [Sistotremastrum niveocremeum HHB9708]